MEQDGTKSATDLGARSIAMGCDISTRRANQLAARMHCQQEFVKPEFGRRERRKNALVVTAIKKTMRAKYQDASETLPDFHCRLAPASAF
jgi:hypothetical protein